MDDITQKAVNFAAAALARRVFSRRELAEKLRSKGFDRGVSEAALDVLTDNGLLDERLSAEAFARYFSERGYTGHVLLSRVMTRGFDYDTAREATSEFAQREDNELLEKMRVRIGAARDAASISRTVAYFTRRGYPVTEVRRALLSLNLDLDIEDEYE